ncbi:CD166 antigen-like isoform X1 [Stegostoma tigrinum]|uniref:CD166 antigen-like isoform X1 n=1 Tax=Stegostoma tigrinum TaxID=3053191 RepID=UPI00202AEA05|nr:CD166 antigen-like isoform X1 [Stegostoma tigrinum]
MSLRLSCSWKLLVNTSSILHIILSMATAPALTYGLLISMCIHCASSQGHREFVNRTVYAVYGEKLQLPCSVPHGKSEPIRQWLLKTCLMKPWKQIAGVKGAEVQSDESHFQMLENGTLLIWSVGLEDQGLFKCGVAEEGLEIFAVTNVSVFKPPAKPQLMKSYLSFTVGGDSEIGKCIVKDGYPVGNVTWYKNGKVILANGNETLNKLRIMKNQNTGLYTIESTLYHTVSKADINAKFFCEVVYPFKGGNGTQRSEPITIDVHYPVESVMIEVQPPSGVIREGDNVTLSCTADTNPSPAEYVWEKDGKRLDSLSLYKLYAVTKEDEGEYVCTVYDFDYNFKSAVRVIRVKAGKEDNELDERGAFPAIAEESHSADHHGQPIATNRAAMVIGILMTLMAVAFFTSMAYYLCYYRKKTEKKPLENLEEKRPMDPENVPSTVEKVIREE